MSVDLEEQVEVASVPRSNAIGWTIPKSVGVSDIRGLTAAMVRGDEGAYREFYHVYFDRLLRYLLVVTAGQEEDAREALQATLLRVVRHIKPFDSGEVFWSWLTVLARSAVVDHHRKQRSYTGLLNRFFRRAPQNFRAAPAEPDTELLSLLEVHLTSLTIEERELIERKYFEKASVFEIAAALGTTEKAIESRLVRVRRKLKELILSHLNK